MPGNRLAFAVGVSRQDKFVGALHGLGDFLVNPGRLAVGVPVHLEVLVRFHGTILRWQVADVAKRGDHFKVASQVFVDCFGLGGRLDDDDVHGGFEVFVLVYEVFRYGLGGYCVYADE